MELFPIFDSEHDGFCDIIIHIFQYLPFPDLGSWCCVNKKMNRYLRDHLINKKNFIIKYLVPSPGYKLVKCENKKGIDFDVYYKYIIYVGKIFKPHTDKAYDGSNDKKNFDRYCAFTENFCLKTQVLYSLNDRQIDVVSRTLVKIYLMRDILKHHQYINF